MARPTSRHELLTAAESEFARLWEAVDRVATDDRVIPGPCDDWSVKDLLAHLHAWHEMALGWEAVGSAGGAPEMPAPGLRWVDTPSLNATIYEASRDDPWDDVVARVSDSHERVLALIASYSDEDLFTKRRFAWTGSTSVGSYLISASSSHYAWASQLIRRWEKVRTAD